MKTSIEEKKKYIESGSQISAELHALNPAYILDCGACDGLDSIIYSRMFPEAIIYAIEAVTDNYNELIDNITEFGCKNVNPGRFCLSDCIESIKFYLSHGDSGTKKDWDTGNKSSSILKPAKHLDEHPWCKFYEDRTTTTRFDSLGIPRIDYIHLDVQGAELKVLRGMGTVLDTVKMVWMEVATVELYEGQPLKTDVEGFMRAAGFALKYDSTRRFGDQLWIR